MRIACPDKDTVYEEAFRILRAGAWLSISDIVLTESIDHELRERFQSTWAGCLGGAIPEEACWQMVGKAGFAEIQIVARHLLTPEELEAMACCSGEEFTPPPGKEDRALMEGKVASVKFRAMKLPTLRLAADSGFIVFVPSPKGRVRQAVAAEHRLDELA